MIYDDLLAALKAPQSLEDFADLLDRIDLVLRSGNECLFIEQLGRDYEDKLMVVLLTKIRFYVLVLAAQHCLIRDLRTQLEHVDA